jgi:ribosome maturation factor RimP
MPGGSRHASAADPGRADHGRTDEGAIADVIRPVVHASGMDLESVRVKAAGRRRLLRVVVDRDHGVSLDDAAAASRNLSSALDAAGVMGDFPYTLEVSSPGVDRPLTEPRHWRRAAGRLVEVKVADDGTVLGRVLSADDGEVVLDVDGAGRHLPYAKLGPGAIQVEFGRLPQEPKEPKAPKKPKEPKRPGARDGH